MPSPPSANAMSKISTIIKISNMISFPFSINMRTIKFDFQMKFELPIERFFVHFSSKTAKLGEKKEASVKIELFTGLLPCVTGLTHMNVQPR
jgi:hypothetical protein